MQRTSGQYTKHDHLSVYWCAHLSQDNNIMASSTSPSLQNFCTDLESHLPHAAQDMASSTLSVLSSKTCAWNLICHCTGHGIIHLTCAEQQDMRTESHLSLYRTWQHPPHLCWGAGLVHGISSISVQNRSLFLHLKFPTLFLNFSGPRKCHFFY